MECVSQRNTKDQSSSKLAAWPREQKQTDKNKEKS